MSVTRLYIIEKTIVVNSRSARKYRSINFLHLYQDYIVDKNYLIVDRLLCSGFDQATKLLLRLWLKGYPDN